jgi:hypothetical protein
LSPEEQCDYQKMGKQFAAITRTTHFIETERRQDRVVIDNSDQLRGTSICVHCFLSHCSLMIKERGRFTWLEHDAPVFTKFRAIRQLLLELVARIQIDGR